MMLLVSACGPASLYDAPKAHMPPAVVPYYNEFVGIIGQSRVTNGDIHFADDKYFSNYDSRHYVIGLCVKIGNTPWTIFLRKSYWDAYPQFQKEVVFHELTHCILNHMEHSSDYHSYMYPSQTHPPDLDQQVSSWL